MRIGIPYEARSGRSGRGRKVYDKAGADEVVFLDITASSDHRATVVDMVRKVAEKVFIPFTVGGGIRTVEDFKVLLREGADKISINSSAINTPELIGNAAGQVWQPVCGLVAKTDIIKQPTTSIWKASWKDFANLKTPIRFYLPSAY